MAATEQYDVNGFNLDLKLIILSGCAHVLIYSIYPCIFFENVFEAFFFLSFGKVLIKF